VANAQTLQNLVANFAARLTYCEIFKAGREVEKTGRVDHGMPAGMAEAGPNIFRYVKVNRHLQPKICSREISVAQGSSGTSDWFVALWNNLIWVGQLLYSEFVSAADA
jgi:hypothetical protein